MAKYQSFLNRISAGRDRAALRGIFSMFLSDNDPPQLETVVVGNGKAVIQGMNDFPLITVTSLTSGATVQLTAAQVIGGMIIDAVTAANTATLPTAASIVAAIPNCRVGTSFLLTYKNAATGAYTITVAASTGSTVVGTATIAQNNTKIFRAVVTNVTSGAEAVTFYSIGTLVH